MKDRTLNLFSLKSTVNQKKGGGDRNILDQFRQIEKSYSYFKTLKTNNIMRISVTIIK